MKGIWPLQEARARLSELVRTATREGPQKITIRGETAAVVISAEDYARLVKRKPTFVDLIRFSPMAGFDLEITRDRSPDRRVDL